MLVALPTPPGGRVCEWVSEQASERASVWPDEREGHVLNMDSYLKDLPHHKCIRHQKCIGWLSLIRSYLRWLMDKSFT